MAEFLQIAHEGLNNAYIIFSLFLGVYAGYLSGAGKSLSGNFWGAMWVNTFLAGAVFFVTLLLLLPFGFEAKRFVYYLYAIYFVISLPGLFSILQGNDNRRAAFYFGIVALFNGAAAYRAGEFLVTPWQ